MQPTEEKAIRLIVEERVDVTMTMADDLGDYTVVRGVVKGDHDTYQVSIDPSGEWCSCPHGQAVPGSSCSHTIALSLKAQYDKEVSNGNTRSE